MKYLNSPSMFGMCRAMQAPEVPEPPVLGGHSSFGRSGGRVPAAGSRGCTTPGQGMRAAPLTDPPAARPASRRDGETLLALRNEDYSHSPAPGTAALSWERFHSSGTALLPLSARHCTPRPSLHPGSAGLGDGALFNPFVQPLPGRISVCQPLPAAASPCPGLQQGQQLPLCFARGSSSLPGTPGGLCPLCLTLLRVSRGGV